MSHFLGKNDLEVKHEENNNKKQRRERRMEPEMSKETKQEARCRLLYQKWHKGIANPDAHLAGLVEYMKKNYLEKGLDDPVNRAYYESLPLDVEYVPKIQRK